MLLTPYPQVFNIPVTTRLVMVTVAAHAIFGIGLGLTARRLAIPSRPLAITSQPQAPSPHIFPLPLKSRQPAV